MLVKTVSDRIEAILDAPDFRKRVRALRVEAVKSGDVEMQILCIRALNGHTAERWECAIAIAEDEAAAVQS
jgi:hypothetical protein